MITYIIKRILLIIPSLLFVIILSFILLNYSPGNPADRLLSDQSSEATNANSINTFELKRLREKLGIDLPVFYFSITEGKIINNNIPVPLIVYNKKNRFDNWFFGDGIYNHGIIRGDLGRSWMTGQKVSSVIGDHIGWSLLLTIISVILAWLISVPLGIKIAKKAGSSFDRRMRILFSILFSLPAFWLATLLMFTFSNPGVLNILPSSGVSPAGGFEPSISFFQKIILTIPYLILPTICYTYASVAFVSSAVRSSMIQTLEQDYIRTARAKGLSEKIVIRRHAWRNSLLPIITIFSHLFPAVIGGSVILETVFSIPGMGLTIYQSIISLDYPVVIAIFLVTGIITLSGFLITDIIYAVLDPRISFQKNTN